MDTMNQFRPEKGMDVFGSDSEKIGEVDEVHADHFVVRKGFFFPEDHYIPMEAIANQSDEGVYLNVTKDQALEQQWNVAPEPRAHDTGAAGTTDTAYRDADVDVAGTTDADLHDRDVADTAATGHAASERHQTNIPVHEEELVANKREVDRGSVEVNKRVVEEEAEVDVPVTEEHVEVTRRAVDREVQPGDDAFEEGTVEVPVHGEEVDVEKRTRVVEEVDVDKTAETHTEAVRDTVRREDVEIDGEKVDPDHDRR